MRCGCKGKSWALVKGAPGTLEENARLGQVGFVGTRDADGDFYYVLPEGPIIHLYEDGTWDVNNFATEESLEAYLAGIEPKLADIRRMV
ncbi:MAG TPA: hypothetical protein VMH05_09290 [Bryobacteraceae bacterium]|nr:hypothetical protein [Bryobacteraceae bacterium]